jgi:hypothetical protein
MQPCSRDCSLASGYGFFRKSIICGHNISRLLNDLGKPNRGTIWRVEIDLTGRECPILSTDQNTAATMQNSAVMAGLTAILAAGMGIAAPHASGGTSGIPKHLGSIDLDARAGIRVRRSEHADLVGTSAGTSLPGPIVTTARSATTCDLVCMSLAETRRWGKRSPCNPKRAYQCFLGCG